MVGYPVVVDLLIENPDGLTTAAISSTTGVHRATVFWYLWTLDARRYVEHGTETGVYRFGFAFLSLYSWQVDALVRRMRDHLESVRDQVGETANLGLLDRSRVIYLDIVESNKSIWERKGSSAIAKPRTWSPRSTILFC